MYIGIVLMLFAKVRADLYGLTWQLCLVGLIGLIFLLRGIYAE
jgi:hypothetical protein